MRENAAFDERQITALNCRSFLRTASFSRRAAIDIRSRLNDKVPMEFDHAWATKDDGRYEMDVTRTTSPPRAIFSLLRGEGCRMAAFRNRVGQAAVKSPLGQSRNCTWCHPLLWPEVTICAWSGRSHSRDAKHWLFLSAKCGCLGPGPAGWAFAEPRSEPFRSHQRRMETASGGGKAWMPSSAPQKLTRSDAKSPLGVHVFDAVKPDTSEKK